MARISYKISIPVILAGFFAIIAFIALDYQRLNAGFYLLLLFIAIYVFFFGFATGQRFASPVKKLLERATELSKGNLSSRVYLETKDEISELAKVFNEIAEDLEQSHAKEESTERSVDIKVKAKTQALEETINALEQKVQNRTIELQRLVADLDRFKGESKTKEAEAILLREELQKLKEGAKRIIYKKLSKKRKTAKAAVPGIKKIVEDLEKLQKQSRETEEEAEELISKVRKVKERIK